MDMSGLFMVMNNLPLFFALLAVVVVVVLTELIKKLDKKDRLKGYRVYIPFALSFVVVGLLRSGNFFPSEQYGFWALAVFAVSVFFFEAILKKLKTVFGE
ncbi:MAG: hypothetical protein FWG29_01810 [Treponema sp.]|nr:hypothetical protein [Treponema sp.]